MDSVWIFRCYFVISRNIFDSTHHWLQVLDRDEVHSISFAELCRELKKLVSFVKGYSKKKGKKSVELNNKALHAI